MSDYSAMTDDELRRAIAERLGHQVILETVTVEWFDAPLAAWWLVLSGGPRCWLAGPSRYKTVSGAWNEAIDRLPNWPVDAGAALQACMKLAREQIDYLLIEPNGHDTWGASMGPLGLEGVRTSFEVLHCPTEARALAELLAAALEVVDEAG